ncbi:MAG TPA: MarR family transcriptional regulator [Candidatus Nitrosocosmicus sp.]|nr:MarR family transcriptional regulator [Candidatus Nitrosocosmicus sp.]
MITTFRLGLLQNKAFRNLKQWTSRMLAPYSLSSSDWAILGLLFENKEGMRILELAKEMGVEPPFVTVLIDSLEVKKLVICELDKKDKRAKTARLTKKGFELVPEIEKILKKGSQDLLKGVSKLELLAYFRVLQAIVRNQ